jgi:hypothetical protein
VREDKKYNNVAGIDSTYFIAVAGILWGIIGKCNGSSSFVGSRNLIGFRTEIRRWHVIDTAIVIEAIPVS